MHRVLRFLLNRPVGVGIIFLSGILMSILTVFHLPVSLLPELNVPYVTVAVKIPGKNPEDIEKNYLLPLREALLTLDHLKDIGSTALDETGTITLQYEHGTNMNLAYLDVNEKIDRLIAVLPRGTDRPLVMKTASSDIPVLHIQAVPATEGDLAMLSAVAKHVLKRRLEQIEGVGLVDMNGLQEEAITVELNHQQLIAHQINPAQIAAAITAANIDMGSVSVRDGNYRYILKIAPLAKSVQDLKRLPIALPSGHFLRLHQVANVALSVDKAQGFHLFQSKPCVVLAVHKQPDARLPDLVPRLHQAIEQFQQDYPTIRFSKSQDQSLLLTLSLENMYSTLLWGGLFAFVVLFLFMGNWAEPVIMGITLPISLLLSFSLLHVLDISINIISLNGLALGMGMLVDNSIVVIDNITLKKNEGLGLLESCVRGTCDVAVPLLSSALTNMAVFVPLIFMGGASGELFYDQALSVAAILSASLVCTFVLVPSTYLIFFRNKKQEAKKDSRVFTHLKKYYHQSFLFVWRHKTVSLILFLLLIPLAFFQLMSLPKTAFPAVQRWETLAFIDWNEPISLEENQRRVKAAIAQVQAAVSEANGGFRQFIFGSLQYTVQQADIYFLFADTHARQDAHQRLHQWFTKNYPQAHLALNNAPDPFEQVFANNNPLLEVRFRSLKAETLIPLAQADSLLNKLNQLTPLKKGKGFEKETSIVLHVDFNKLSAFGVSYNTLVEELKRLLDDYPITGFKNMGTYTPILFRQSEEDLIEKIHGSLVQADNGSWVPLRNLVSYKFSENYKAILADQAGIYQAVSFELAAQAFEKENDIKQVTMDHSLAGTWQGQWFDNEKDFRQLLFVMLISLVLMYVILTAEFESLRQPLLVLASFPIGLTGSLLLLWVAGESINVMSGIGLVVVLGILDNDAILKIDRINTLRKTLPLQQAIEQAGLDRFKPIVMNTLTNVLAITPIIFSDGLGADLQRPVSLVIIGGLIVATITALYFIPLLYWMIDRKRTDAD
jgi:multidrug efflux pump subunit AcrB